VLCWLTLVPELLIAATLGVVPPRLVWEVDEPPDDEDEAAVAVIISTKHRDYTRVYYQK